MLCPQDGAPQVVQRPVGSVLVNYTHHLISPFPLPLPSPNVCPLALGRRAGHSFQAEDSLVKLTKLKFQAPLSTQASSKILGGSWGPSSVFCGIESFYKRYFLYYFL